MWKKSHIIILLAVIFILFSVFIIKFNAGSFLKNPLGNIPFETQEIPNYVSYDTVYTSRGKTDLGQVLQSVNEKYDLLQIFGVFENTVYFVYSSWEKSDSSWEIGSYNLNTFEFRSHCMLENPKEVYRRKFEEKYVERNGYCLDGEIILNDHKHVVVYNIINDNAQIYSYEEYEFPTNNSYGEYIDNTTIKLTLENSSKRYTLEEMAYKSDSIKEIFNLKDMKIWNGRSSLHKFFSQGAIQVIGSKVYVSGRWVNFWGKSYAVILEYDVQSDSWKYVTNCQVEDVLIDRFYVIL